VSFLSILGHSFFDFPRERVTSVFFFYLIAGLFAALHKKNTRLSAPSSAIALILLFLLSLLQVAFTTQLLRFNDHMYRAIQAEHIGNWSMVSTETDRARQIGLFHPDAVSLGGYAFNIQGQFDQAYHLYHKTEKYRPYDIQLLNGQAIAAQNLGKFDEAQNTYQKILAMIPSLPDVRYNLAGLYLQTGQPQKAAQEYQRVLETETSSLDLYYRIGQSHLLAQNQQAAIHIFKQAYQIMPTSGMAHIQQIEHLYQAYRRADLAADCYAIFLQYWPGDAKEIAQQRLTQLQSQSSRP
jgi:tetratricopeptide (TPR) repeat protein